MSSTVITDIAGIRRRLTERRQEICAILKTLHLNSAQLAAMGHMAGDRTEDAQDKAASDVELQKARVLSADHARITRALRRMDMGTYGICIDCGEEIPRQRLTYLPFAEMCIPCQTETENERSARCQ